MRRLPDETLDVWVEQLEAEESAEDQDDLPKEEEEEPWLPSLNPTQLDLYLDDSSRYILCYGNRAGGKSYGVCEKMVRHCYRNDNALVYVIAKDFRQLLDGGIFQKLTDYVLPEWGEGAMVRQEGSDELVWRDGIGLQHSGIRYTKGGNPFIEITTFNGQKSKIMAISAPYPSLIVDKMKGPEFTMVVIEEGTTLPNNKAYFTNVIMQLGRRKGILGEQQYIILTNPSGKKHWIYQQFFINSGFVGGKIDPSYRIFRFDHAENKQNMPDGYMENSVVAGLADDPIQMKRMVEGEWEDYPEGDALYGDYYRPKIHVPGYDSTEGDILLPFKDYPITIGYDLGQRFNSISLMQEVVVEQEVHWLVFDELYMDRKTSYDLVTKWLMEKMEWWCEIMETEFEFEHISDNSALKQFRPGGDPGGSHDALDIQRNSEALIELGIFKWLKEPIIMEAAPKAKGSVEARVKIVKNLLRLQRIHISSLCMKHQEMFEGLPSDKDQSTGDALPNTPKKPHILGHINDSLSYPIITKDIRPGFSGGRRETGNRFLDMD